MQLEQNKHIYSVIDLQFIEYLKVYETNIPIIWLKRVLVTTKFYSLNKMLLHIAIKSIRNLLSVNFPNDPNHKKFLPRVLNKMACYSSSQKEQTFLFIIGSILFILYKGTFIIDVPY